MLKNGIIGIKSRSTDRSRQPDDMHLLREGNLTLLSQRALNRQNCANSRPQGRSRLRPR